MYEHNGEKGYGLTYRNSEFAGLKGDSGARAWPISPTRGSTSAVVRNEKLLGSLCGRSLSMGTSGTLVPPWSTRAPGARLAPDCPDARYCIDRVG